MTESIKVIECGHFWAQYGEEENYKQLYQVQEFLNKDRGRSLKVSYNLISLNYCIKICAAAF